MNSHIRFGTGMTAAPGQSSERQTTGMPPDNRISEDFGVRSKKDSEPDKGGKIKASKLLELKL
ncbi:MAG: hypothetical protein V1721_04925 [Pseudomonadota bacterium]